MTIKFILVSVIPRMILFNKIFTLYVLFLFASKPVNAQKNNMDFYYLTTDDGLSYNKVSCILRDSRDYMWFGTANGLNKYNGSQITIYKNDPGIRNTICGNRIMCIVEDSAHNIWVGTTSGLSMYNASADSFISFIPDRKAENSISSNFIYCLFVDRQQNLWIGCGSNEGLNKWNTNSNTFTRYRLPNSTRKGDNNAITSIVQDKMGNLWLASRLHEGIVKFEPKKLKFTVYPSRIPIPNDKNYLFIDNDGIIWISTFGSGLYSFDPTTKIYTSYNSIGNGKGTNSKIINNFVQEDENHILIAVDQGGINIYNKQTKLFEYIKHDPSIPNGLNNDGIWYLYKDKENILWVGTSGEGIDIYNPKAKKFKLFRNITQRENTLCYNVVNSLYEDSKGLIWIDTDGGGISIYNPKTGIFKNYKSNPQSKNSLPCNVIRNVVEDRNHNFWFGSWDCGLIKLDHSSGKFIQYLPGSPSPYNISGSIVWNQMIDHKGIIWLSIYNVGLDLIDPDKGIIKRIRLNPNIKAYNSQSVVNYIYEDSHRNIWLCTRGGLKLLDPTTNMPKPFSAFPENIEINTILEDKDGNYWVGTSTIGLVEFALNGRILKQYTVSGGLPDNSICGILEDDSHNIWISTNNGLCRLNYRSGDLATYSKSDGLQDKQFVVLAFFKTKSGEMYFGGVNGFNSFFPDSIKHNNYIPKVYIDKFLLFNKPVGINDPDSPLHKVIQQTKEIVLSWKQSVFSFGFTAINYTHPEKNLYAYKMEGFDKDWNYTNASNRMTTYTNLDPGTYIFHVKASNNDIVWNSKGTSIKIVIIPPFWQTWYFRGGLIFLIASLVYLIFAFRMKNVKKQSRKLERLVEERTSQLKRTNKELEAFAYSISHDLRAPLRGIDGFSMALLEDYHEKLDAEGKEYLHRVRAAAQRMAHLIDDMLNLSKVSQAEMNIQSVNLSAIAREITNNLSKQQPERIVEFIIQPDIIVKGDTHLLNVALVNLFDNAWKFTSKHQGARIEFGIFKQGEKSVYFIKDDGAGFDMKYSQKLFGTFQRFHNTSEFPGTGIGLATVQRIIHRHAGSIWAKSETEKGTTFYFTINKGR